MGGADKMSVSDEQAEWEKELAEGAQGDTPPEPEAGN